ncbi:MAG TPA: methyltransferase domain-containing protein [Methylomirabilota bacterium]|nr:methyltransferase domain-containing protein [Methylomirabilota bacterium]
MATFSAATLERIYSTPDVVEQRARTRLAVAARSRERGLDLGCGPGLLACELARDVGPRGRIVGIDTSAEMIAMCAERARRDALSGRTEFHQGDAGDLRFPAGSFDFLTVTQVYEYVQDMKRALADAYRVLRPRGRIVIVDTDWESCVWNSDDRERMARILKAHERHFAHPHLPAQLPHLLADAGFTLKSVQVIPIINLQLTEHTFSHGMIDRIRSFVVAKGGIRAEEAQAWAADVRSQAERGQYFFSLCRYMFVAERPRSSRGDDE